MLIIAASRIGTPPSLFRKADMPHVRIDLKKGNDPDDRLLNVKRDREDD
jgi:hypothetical protein